MDNVIKLQQPEAVPARPELGEIAGVGRDDIFLGFVKATGFRPESVLLNPDQVLETQARGRGLALYDELLRDPHIFSVVQTRQQAVIGKEWDVLAAADDAEHQAQAEFVREALKRVPCLTEDMREALDAIVKGFSIQEIIWAVGDGGLMVSDLKHRDPRRFAFALDGSLRLLTAAQSVEGVPVPERKFIHTVFGKKYENPYGDGLGARLYWYWWFKKHGIKFWVIFAEKFGMPTAVGKYPPGATPDQKKDLKAALAAIQQETGILVPQGVEIAFLEAQRTGTVNTYRELCDFCDAQISKAVLGQTLTTQEGQSGQGGSFALGKVHGDVRQDYVEADAAALAAAWNGSLVRWLVEFNFSRFLAPPAFYLRVTPEADLLALAQRDERLTLMGVRIPQRYFYETYKVPEPRGDEPVAEPPRSLPLASDQPSAISRQPGLLARFADPEPMAPDPHAERVSDHAEALYLAALPRGLDAYDALIAELRRELTAASTYDAAIKRLPEALSPEELGPFGEGLYAALLTAHLAARGTVIVEAAQVGAQVAKLAAPGTLPFEITAPLPPEEAISWFNSLRPVTARGFADLAESLRATAFRVAKLESQGLITAVKDALGRSLTEGTTFRDFLERVDGVFDRAGVTRLNPYHAETVFRTNLKTAYEAGRLEQFTDPEVAGFFPYFQYHAVLDGATRPTHAAMHGRIYRTDSAVWQTWYPPAGFSCRCTVTAVSAVEAEQRGLRESAPLPAWIQPDRGFGGSPVAALRRGIA